MTAQALPHPPRSRALVGLLLALLVQAGWLLLLQLGRPVHSLQEKPVPIELHLIAPPAVRPALRHVSPGVMAARPALPPRVDEEAQGVTVSTMPVQLPSSPTPATSVPVPLNLSLPAQPAASSPRAPSMLSQMLNDPRARSVKGTVESALADAAGTLPITTAGSTDGTQSKLIRQGSKCIRVAESRIKTLNPMDENSKGAPDVVGACF